MAKVGLRERIQRNAMVRIADSVGVPSGVIRDAFEAMEIADSVCSEAGDPPGLFTLLRPSDVLRGKAKQVLRHHMNEVATMYKNGCDTTVATEAEVLCGLLATATVMPLDRTGTSLAAWLFSHVFQQSVGEDDYESYPGEREERIADARNKLRQEWRRVEKVNG